ncbi:MAG: BatD family protein [bacterium]
MPVADCRLPILHCLLPIACCLLSLPAIADVKLQVSSSRQTLYLGESFNLTIMVNGADRGIAAPDLSAFPPADIQFLGQRSNSRSSITIINGRMTRESVEAREFAFQIKPSKEGAFKAGPIRVTVAGKTYADPGVNVQVTGVEKQDSVLAAVTASSTSVLVEEPFTVTLSVAVAELPDPYAENNEPGHPNFLPHPSAAFLDLRQTTPGLKGPDLNQFLNGLIDQSGRQPAFAINDYQTRDAGGFSGFFDNDPFSPRPIRFRLTPKKITLSNKKYREYSLSLDYTPTKEGEFTFGPLSFKGPVIVGVSADRQAVTRDIYTIGPAVTVRVVPPPDEGRPEWFTGSVGKSMKATAAFDATVCKVGDPLTLTLELTGPISISNLRTPLLNLQPELAKDFRIYDDNVSADTLPNGKRFKYRVRPTREGTLEFQPIKLAYYDTVARAYTTVTTAPVPIQARPTTQIATAADNGTENQTDILSSRTRPVPAGITLSAQGACSGSLLPPHRITRLLLLAGPMLCLSAAFVTPLMAFIQALRTRRRRSGALHRAQGVLRHADTPELAAYAIRSYLADRLDVTGNALTPLETAALLCQRNVPAESAAVCRDLLAQLDEAMYRPDASAPLSEIIRPLKALLPLIDAALAAPPAKPEDAP